LKKYGDQIQDVCGREDPPKFNYVVCLTEELKYLDSMIIDELEGSLRAHEERMKRR